jgi:hypothetical protein
VNGRLKDCKRKQGCGCAFWRDIPVRNVSEVFGKTPSKIARATWSGKLTTFYSPKAIPYIAAFVYPPGTTIDYSAD